MSDPNSENRKKARETPCPSPSTPEKLTNPPERPAEKCSPGTERLPDVFVTPSAAPTPPPPAQLLPDPIVIGNDRLTLSCSDIVGAGPVGDEFVLAENTLTYSFFFQTVPSIQPKQLTYIASLSASTIASISSPSATVSFIRSVTKLDIPQAEFIKMELDALRAVAAQESAETAASLIDCYWENSEQSATCPGDAIMGVGPDGLAISNPVVIPQGQFRSRVSQEDADALAESFATNSLVCVYGNDMITRTCVDLGFDPIPVDSEPVGNAPGPRVGTVTVAAGTFYASSKTEANALATAAAESSLSCFYLSVPFTRSCSDLGFDNLVVQDPVNISLGIGGNPITVPQGWTYSNVSQAAANAAAVAAADSLLDCYWVNDEQATECEDQTVTLPGEDPVVIEPSPDSPTLSITIPAGEVESRISKADANEQALQLALLQLDCIYCNELIPPLCIPTDLVGYPIPIPPEMVTDDWSVDATLGVAAGTYCSNNATESQQIAETIGQIPASLRPTGVGCVYENDEQQAECENQEGLSPYAVPQPGSFVTLAAGVIRVRDDEVPVDWEPLLPLSTRAKSYANYLAQQQAMELTDCFYTNSAAEFLCTPTATGPGAVTSVTVPANMFTSYVSKTEADALATAYGNSLLYCYYEATAEAECAAGLVQGAPGSLLTTTAVGYGMTPAEATAAAEALAASLLRCIYVNVDKTSVEECGPGLVLAQYGYVPAGTVTGATPAAADELAQIMAEGLKVCINPDEFSTPGAPGNDGAQTNCSGDCFGYYA